MCIRDRRSDPRTAELYQEIPNMLPARVVWRRLDLPRPSEAESAKRIAEAVAQFPSYRTALSQTQAQSQGR